MRLANEKLISQGLHPSNMNGALIVFLREKLGEKQ
jgi:hypothetical protein